MKYLRRAITRHLQEAIRQFPAVLVTGPRQCGKTTLLRHTFSNAHHVLLEDPDVVARVNSDPRGFLNALHPPVILDEIQNTPALFSYLRTRIDQDTGAKGQWLLTGSQEAPLMKGVTESMAGRVCILELLPLSTLESDGVNLLAGGYPDVALGAGNSELWFRSYIQTYLERDVRAVTAIKDLATFRRFLALIASRHGQILNKTDLAAPLGVSVPTISSWLSVLEITAQIVLVPPFLKNFGKRLVKAPRLYFLDSGLVCHLLGIRDQQTLDESPFRGPLFEGFAASEIIKCQANAGRRKELYYFRDHQGLEVDFIVPRGAGRLLLIEAKATGTPIPNMARSMQRLAEAIKDDGVESFLLHSGSAESQAGEILTEGVTTGSLPQLLSKITHAK